MELPVLTICTPRSSARLRFVLDWLFKERLGLDYRLVHVVTDDAHCINYGLGVNGLSIFDAGLLWQTGAQPLSIATDEWNGRFILYPDTDASKSVPFDLFSGIFYLLSRYEEYQQFTPDKHGRYPHSESILRDVLERPVVDEWVEMLRQILEQRLQISIPETIFTYKPSYDIDIAWSYRHKGWKRWTGAAFRELIKGYFSSLFTRCKVAMGSVRDPYDAFRWMHKLHQQNKLRPNYFILSTLHATAFDKNIPPQNPAMKRLIKSLQKDGGIGIHPSYFTKGDPEKLTEEKTALEAIIQTKITDSRQHFIRLFFPDTYRMLLNAGIEDDYSMGYSTALGFRAGTSHSFPWYDLQKEQQTALRIHPFCFMDTTAHFDLQLSVSEAFVHLLHIKQHLEKCGGTLTTIFHNFSLGTDKEWAGWSDAYAKFIAEMAEKTGALI